MLDYVLYIGRFQPFHKGHLEVLKYALTKSHQVIICIGSAQESRTDKNPFTLNERVEMIKSNLTDYEQERITFIYSNDFKSHDLWAGHILNQMHPFVPVKSKIGLIGFNKSDESKFLSYFPKHWEYITSGFTYHFINATELRHTYFVKNALDNISMPTKTFIYLLKFKESLEFKILREKAIKMDKDTLEYGNSLTEILSEYELEFKDKILRPGLYSYISAYLDIANNPDRKDELYTWEDVVELFPNDNLKTCESVEDLIRRTKAENEAYVYAYAYHVFHFIQQKYVNAIYFLNEPLQHTSVKLTPPNIIYEMHQDSYFDTNIILSN